MRRPDTAYVNGKVYTVDGKFSVVSAFCVEGDRFVAAGTDDEIRALCTPETKIIDLGGKCVLPGLIDSHLHVNNTGAMKMELNIVGRQAGSTTSGTTNRSRRRKSSTPSRRTSPSTSSAPAGTRRGSTARPSRRSA